MEADTQNSPVTSPMLPALASLEVKGTMDAVVEYKDGLKFHLRFVKRSALKRMFDTCTENKWDEKAKTRVPRLNTDAFTAQFCKAAVLGWEGATIRVLSGIAPLNTDNLTAEQIDAEFPFTQESLVFLMKNSYDLDDFLQNAACDVKFFKTGAEDEAKN